MRIGPQTEGTHDDDVRKPEPRNPKSAILSSYCFFRAFEALGGLEPAFCAAFAFTMETASTSFAASTKKGVSLTPSRILLTCWFTPAKTTLTPAFCAVTRLPA